MKKKRLLIYGMGTIAEIAGYYFQTDSRYEIAAFVDQAKVVEKSSKFMGKPLISLEVAMEQYGPSDVEFFVAIGYQKTNSVRQKRYQQIKEYGYNCANYISSRAIVFSDKIGENCLILENNVLQPFTEIGHNVTMWSGNHLGHHSVVEDNVFISSHVVISGRCTIRKNSFIGVNSCLHDGVDVGEKSVIGAGSVVSKSCEKRSVFMSPKSKLRIIDKDII
ncbi:acetyltransferase [Opitutales bacterium]|nr:acetyltransferase [Opitutales bacterium]